MTKQRLTIPAAFTLIELLAAMAVLAMLMTIMFGIFNQASKAWLLAENRTENFQGARAVLDMMSRELESAMVGIHTNANGSTTRLNLITFEDSGPANVPTDSGMATPSFSSCLTGTLGSLNATPPNDAIFFITQAPDSKSAGTYIDQAECGYFVVYSTANSNSAGLPKGSYGLFRHYATSNTPNSWDVYGNPANWWSTLVSVKTPILDNVIRFEVRYEYANTAGGTTNGTSICENWNTYTQGPDSAMVPDPTTQLPRAFHLRLSVIDRRYAARLASILNGTPLTSTQLGNVPYSLSSLPPAIQRTFTEGLRTFYRSVYPRCSS